MMHQNNNQKILNIIKQAEADTNYIKDDKPISTYFEEVFRKWIISFMLINLLIYIYQSIGNSMDFNTNEVYYIIIRIGYLILYPLSLIYYFFLIQQRKHSLKERDFLKLYAIVPCIIIFTKIVPAISYYLQSGLFLTLSQSISLDVLALIISSILMKFYFRDNNLNKFTIFNIAIYLIILFEMSYYITLSEPSELIIKIDNIIRFLQDNGLFVLAHFTYVIIYIKKAMLE